MKFLINKIYIILLLFIIFNYEQAFAKDNNISYKKYKSENISNYFSGIISVNNDHDIKAFKHLKKVKSLKNKHSEFNVEFVRTLVLLDKFDEAFAFSKSAWNEEELVFEIDLLLGIGFFLKKDYLNAEKHFERLNKISRYNFFFKDFIGNVLISWSRLSQGKQEDSLKFLEQIPEPYQDIKNIQSIFLKCYFDDSETQKHLEKLVKQDRQNFSRYNFFLVNYLLFKEKNIEAKKIIKDARKKHNSNLLLKQTESFLHENDGRIKKFFDCKNPKDSLAEFFYVMANLFSSEGEYQLSNFYIKISLFLNNKFLTNKTLLAENFFYQGKNDLSINVYDSLKSIGSDYAWFATKNIAQNFLKTKGKKYSTEKMQREFNLVTNPNFEHYYSLANFYRDNDYYKESIKYYSLALKNINKDHPLVAKILYRKGASHERLGEWEKAEKDLLRSLEILPEQAHVLNYLAYSWIDQGKNLDVGLEMIKKATELRKDDGYIIDSLGWAYYLKKNYGKAEMYLQRAVELLPLDPVINDHYADALWMQNKDIQARYFWNYILKLDDSEEELKDSAKKKLIFGINKKL